MYIFNHSLFIESFPSTLKILKTQNFKTIPPFQLILKEETEQAPSWKQDSILGRTVDSELYA